MSTTRMLPASARAGLEQATQRYADALAESPAAIAYLEFRGIYVDPDMPEELGNPWLLGLVNDPIPEHEDMQGRLAIPYLVPRGGPVGMKFRCMVDHGPDTSCKSMGHAKYLSHAGMGQRLYGVTSLRIESPVIGITEGELDAIVATEAGIPSVAVPGVKGWSDAWRYLFEGHERVLVFGDGDDPGRAFAEKLTALIPDSRAVPMADGHDVTSFVLEHGVDALRERAA
jgi:hypothetical protein